MIVTNIKSGLMGRFEDGGYYPKDDQALSKVLTFLGVKKLYKVLFLFFFIIFFNGKKALQGAADQDC